MTQTAGTPCRARMLRHLSLASGIEVALPGADDVPGSRDELGCSTELRYQTHFGV